MAVSDKHLNVRIPTPFALNTPVEIVYKLNSEINPGLADPKIKERLAQLRSTPMPMTPAEFIAVKAEK